ELRAVNSPHASGNFTSGKESRLLVGEKMPKSRFTINISSADTAFLVTNALKTPFMVIAGSGKPFDIVEFSISVAAVTGRFYTEIIESTEATAGTKTSTGHKQTGGYTSGTDGTPVSTYGRIYTAEGTTYTPIKVYGWTACPGPLIIQYPLSREPGSLLS